MFVSYSYLCKSQNFPCTDLWADNKQPNFEQQAGQASP